MVDKGRTRPVSVVGLSTLRILQCWALMVGGQEEQPVCKHLHLALSMPRGSLLKQLEEENQGIHTTNWLTWKRAINHRVCVVSVILGDDFVSYVMFGLNWSNNEIVM